MDAKPILTTDLPAPVKDPQTEERAAMLRSLLSGLVPDTEIPAGPMMFFDRSRTPAAIAESMDPAGIAAATIAASSAIAPDGPPLHARDKESITANPTVSGTGHLPADDPLASERAELSARLAAAQAEMGAMLADLARSGASTEPASNQLQALTQLQRQIGTASPATFATLQHEAMAAITATQQMVQASRATTEAARRDDLVADLAEAAADVKSQAGSFMNDRHRYDHLLQFASEAEREAYRQRESDRARRYAEEAAKGTPAGELHAGGEALGQMADLAAHGGAADPALMQRADELAASLHALRAGLLRSGDARAVAQFDQRRREDLREIMHSKGMSDADIDAFMAAHPDPIEATRQFVAGQSANVTMRDLDRMYLKSRGDDKDDAASQTIATAIAVPTPVPSSNGMADTAQDALADLNALLPPGGREMVFNGATVAITAAQATVAPALLDSLGASLQSAGVITADAPATDAPSHGVSAAVIQPTLSGGRGA